MLLLDVTNKAIHITETSTGEGYRLEGRLKEGVFTADKSDLFTDSEKPIDDNLREELMNQLLHQVDSTKFKLLLI